MPNSSSIVPHHLKIRPELDGTVLDHESGLSLVSLPSPSAMLDQTQAKLTQKILDGLGDGLDVGVSGCVVYCHRRGIKTFWSFSKYDRSNQTQEVPKLEPQPLFQFQGFVRGGEPNGYVAFFFPVYPWKRVP